MHLKIVEASNGRRYKAAWFLGQFLIKTIGNLLNPENVHLRRTMLAWFAALILSFALAIFMAYRFPGNSPVGHIAPAEREGFIAPQLSSIGFYAFALSFICSLFTLGMGYGTTITPLLLLAGFVPLQIVPVVLFSQFTIGAIGGFLHHRVGNVDLQRGSMHLQVASILAICSVFGVCIAVFLVKIINPEVVKMIIAVVVILAGVALLTTVKVKYSFSYIKIVILGIVAAFNKGLSGGGYGPVLTSGQMLTGLEGRNAVGITFFAEGITCLVGVILYLILHKGSDFSLAPPLILGGVFALPFTTWIVKRMTTNKLRIVIGVVVTLLGGLVLSRMIGLV